MQVSWGADLSLWCLQECTQCAYSQRAHRVISKFRAAAQPETGGGFFPILYKLLTAACEVHSIWFFTGQNCWCHTFALHSAWEAVLRYVVLWRVLHTQDHPCWCCSSHKNLFTLQSMCALSYGRSKSHPFLTQIPSKRQGSKLHKGYPPYSMCLW